MEQQGPWGPVTLPDLGVFLFGAYRRILPEALALGFRVLYRFFPAFLAFPLVPGLDCWTGGRPLVLVQSAVPFFFVHSCPVYEG